MTGRFPGLIRCDVDACQSLVEPHVGRCGYCRRARGPLTDGQAGWTPPTPGRDGKAHPARRNGAERDRATPTRKEKSHP